MIQMNIFNLHKYLSILIYLGRGDRKNAVLDTRPISKKICKKKFFRHPTLKKIFIMSEFIPPYPFFQIKFARFRNVKLNRFKFLFIYCILYYYYKSILSEVFFWSICLPTWLLIERTYLFFNTNQPIKIY